MNGSFFFCRSRVCPYRKGRRSKNTLKTKQNGSPVRTVPTGEPWFYGKSVSASILKADIQSNAPYFAESRFLQQIKYFFRVCATKCRNKKISNHFLTVTFLVFLKQNRQKVKILVILRKPLDNSFICISESITTSPSIYLSLLKLCLM